MSVLFSGIALLLNTASCLPSTISGIERRTRQDMRGDRGQGTCDMGHRTGHDRTGQDMTGDRTGGMTRQDIGQDRRQWTRQKIKQRTEDRRRRTEDRGQRTEDRGQGRGQGTEDRRQKTTDRTRRWQTIKCIPHKQWYDAIYVCHRLILQRYSIIMI